MNIINKSYQPYFLDYSHRYEIYYGGRASGKTKFICQKLLNKALREKRRILFMMKTGGNVKEGIRKEIIELIDEWNIKALDTKDNKLIIRESDLSIILQNGSELLFKSLDKSEKAKGWQGLSDVYMDEADLFTADDYITINGSLRSMKYKNLQLIISFNPTSMQSWIYKMWFDNKPVPDNTLIVHSTYKDNSFLQPNYHDEVLMPLKTTDPRRYEIDANGLWQAQGKLVFEHNWKVEEFNPYELIKNNEDLEVYCSLDWGYIDPTATAYCLIDSKSKILYICEEIYQRGLTNIEISKLLKEKGWHKYRIIADSANPKDIADLKKMGINKIKPCRKGKNSIISGIKKLQEYQIIIHPKCTNTIIEFNNYTWKQDNNTLEFIETPIDDFCHIIDGLRYIIFEVKKPFKQITVRL